MTQYRSKQNEFEEIKKHQYQGEKITSIVRASEDFLTGKGFYLCVVWGSIIKKSVLKDMAFKPFKFSEDALFMQELLFKAKPSFYLSEYNGYEYIRWENSATLNPNFKKRNLEWAEVNIPMRNLYMKYISDIEIKKKTINWYFNEFVEYISQLSQFNYKDKFINNDLFFDEYKDYISLLKSVSKRKYQILRIYTTSRLMCWYMYKLIILKDKIKKKIKK